jgi:hypothetical protein
MGRTIGGIAAVIALAAIAFSAAYFGGGALTRAPAAQATSGVALHAPGIAASGAPVALRTPTATPAPKPKKHKKKPVHHKRKTPMTQTYTPRATAVPTRVATAVPTRAPVYNPPPAKTAKPKPHKTPGVIIED